jgi:hypothetical protein
VKLSREEADLFFKLMWGLQFYVNRQSQILPNIESREEYAALPMAEKVKVRDALWAHPDLIDAYAQTNPDGLSIGEMEIVRAWKQFISGSFQVFRFLKKYTVFIGEKSQVYGVLGLHDRLEEKFHGRPLPIMVQAVLLPFKGQIVYDGLLQSYNLVFGGGIRSTLKEDYMVAQQNERIITTLEAGGTKSSSAGHRHIFSEDIGPKLEEVLKVSEQIRGGTPIQRATFALLRASTKVAQLAVQRPDNINELWRLGRQVQRVLSRFHTVLDRTDQ